MQSQKFCLINKCIIAATGESSYVGLWNRCLEIIRDNVPESIYKTWFVPIAPLKYEDKTLIIQVPSQFFYKSLGGKFVDLLRKTLYKVIGDDTKSIYNALVDKSSGTTVSQESTIRSMAIPRSGLPRAGERKTSELLRASTVQDLNPHLNPNYNFEIFIEGCSNKLSRSVAKVVVENPARTVFNPLFLHGASGVGKIHLANAIGARIKGLYSDKRVLYVSTHLSQIQYTGSVRSNTTSDFIDFYQTIDVLIIDDVQKFAGVTKTQSTFLHIFNHLHQSDKQLILVSDRAPTSLQGMKERLLTRFKWGMATELEKPIVGLGKNILRNKIYRDGLQFPSGVMGYIAEGVNESVRDLENIVTSIMAYSTIYNKEVGLDLAQCIVRKVVRNETRAVAIDDIIDIARKHFDLESSAIHTKPRKREVVQARQVTMYLAKAHTDFFTSKVGKFIGSKDHTTVLCICKIVKGQCEVDKNFRSDLENIEILLKKRDINSER